MTLIRKADLENHNKDGGFWTVIDGKVYDIKDFQTQSLTGNSILGMIGPSTAWGALCGPLWLLVVDFRLCQTDLIWPVSQTQSLKDLGLLSADSVPWTDFFGAYTFIGGYYRFSVLFWRHTQLCPG